VVDHIVYNSFGQITTESNPTTGFLFGYSGSPLDRGTGLQLDQARYYSPSMGRFLSPDPSSFSAGDVNLYRYVGNDVPNATDPSGLFSLSEALATLTVLGIEATLVIPQLFTTLNYLTVRLAALSTATTEAPVVVEETATTLESAAAPTLEAAGAGGTSQVQSAANTIQEVQTSIPNPPASGTSILGQTYRPPGYNPFRFSQIYRPPGYLNQINNPFRPPSSSGGNLPQAIVRRVPPTTPPGGPNYQG
jgi:RHS repeat-associated protein